MDDQTYERICQDPSAMAKRIKRHIGGKEERFLRQGLRGCPFLTKEGLCGVQKAGRKDLMSTICQEYPRRILTFGEFTETMLELACPRVAELFLQQEGRFSMKGQVPKPGHTMWEMENDDPAFLHFLEQCRTTLIEQITACPTFDAGVQRGVYRFLDEIHEHVLRNQMQEAAVVQPHLLTGDESAGELFYPMELVDKVIAYNIDSVRLFRKHPQLKKLLSRYYHYFNSLTGQEAEAFYETKFREMVQELPKTREKYRAYFIYYLYEMLLAAYEDYHLLKVALLGNMYLQIYRLLDLVAWMDHREQGKDYGIAEQAYVLSNLERRMRHNMTITRGILGRLRNDFL